jgi:hypothetical protein
LKEFLEGRLKLPKLEAKNEKDVGELTEQER